MFRVVLLFLDAGEGVAAVVDALHSASGTVNSLDTDAVITVRNLIICEVDVADSVVGAAANGADTKTVATSARTAREGDVGTRVDSNAIVLVVNNSSSNYYTGR